MTSLRVMIADIKLNPHEALCCSLRVDDSSSSHGLPLMLVPFNIDFWVGPTRAAKVDQQSSNALQRQRTLAPKITTTRYRHTGETSFPFRCCILARATSPPVLQQRTRVQLRLSHFEVPTPVVESNWRWFHIVLLAPAGLSLRFLQTPLRAVESSGSSTYDVAMQYSHITLPLTTRGT